MTRTREIVDCVAGVVLQAAGMGAALAAYGAAMAAARLCRPEYVDYAALFAAGAAVVALSYATLAAACVLHRAAGGGR